MAKSALGKGASALFGAKPFENAIESKPLSKVSSPGLDTAAGGDLLVDVSLLKPNPHQPRTEFDPEALQELADSIKEHGVIQPILIEDAGDGTYYIIAGERRTRASQMAGLKQVPVRIKKYSEENKLEIALIENIQREDLNPVEEALAYQKLIQMGNLNQDDVARRVGKNRSTVANALRLLKLPEDMRSSLSSGEITAGHARALLSVENSTDQRILFARIVGSHLSVREAEQYASSLNGAETNASKDGKAGKKNDVSETKTPAKNPDFQAFEQQLIDALGTKVELQGSFDKGTIKISYFSKDDLDRLYGLITGEK